MKTAVSVSLGSSDRDKQVEIELFGEKVSISREGTDGDIARATARFTELDGQVDALGVGGIDLWVQMDEKRYPLYAAHKMIKNVSRTPVVDGSGLKNTLEYKVEQTLAESLGDSFTRRKVMLTAAVDRFGMTKAFFEQGYQVVCCDMMFALGIPIPIRTLPGLRRMATVMMPIAGRLPMSVLYPTGEKQGEIIPKYTKWYEWADIIAGDCHYIKRHMPDDLAGKVIVTNTTTANDMEMFRQRGVTHVVTTTPQLDGRSFGANMMEAALTAVAGKNRPLTHAELNEMLTELDLKPAVHTL